MWEFLNKVGGVFKSLPFSGASWFVIATLGLIVWLFAIGNRSPNSPVRWEDLMIDTSNNRASPYKLGYLIGMIVSTWIVLTFTDKDKLTYDIFGMYLTYLLGGAGWNAFLKNKTGAAETPLPEEPAK